MTVLIRSVGTTNIVEHAGTFWTVPQRVGPVDMSIPIYHTRPGVRQYPTLDAALAALGHAEPAPPVTATPQPAQAPAHGTPVRAFWVEETGRTPTADGGSIPTYRRLDTGETLAWPLPVGALYVDESGWCKGADGASVVCVCPNGRGGTAEWYIDARASNCDSKCAVCGVMYKEHKRSADRHAFVDARPHQCWVRHGSKPGTIHVDKEGTTCGAGGGSIQILGWHGFLHNGVLGEQP